MEITAQHGRCKNDVVTASMFCAKHQRKPQQHEDDFFDSTTARVYEDVWIGSLDTANDPNALRAAGIKTIVNISGWEPRPKTREMYKKLGIKYMTTSYHDASGHMHYLGDEPLTDRVKLAEFYQFMDRGVKMMQQPKPKGATLIHCFAEDHQLLTNRGFMFLHEMEDCANDDDLLVASYDPSSQQLVYDKYELVINDAQEQTMIEMTSRTDDKHGRAEVSLMATTGHRMYVKRGLKKPSAKGVYWKSHKVWNEDHTSYKYVQNPYAIVEAKDLISRNPRDYVKFLGVAREGIAQHADVVLPFIDALGLTGPEQVEQFLELYGYWLGDESMERLGHHSKGNDALTITPNKDIDKKWLQERLDALSVTYIYTAGQRHFFNVTDKKWIQLFRAQYGCHTFATFHIEPGKWLLWWWVWKLTRDQCRAILRGLKMANGENAIYTSSVRFRDELIRLAMHAGYSPHFRLVHEKGTIRCQINERDVGAQHDTWRVSYNTNPRYAEPKLCASRDIKRVKYVGRTWCVTVPHDFVIARRAHYDVSKGYVTSSSRPIISKNCHAGINRSASLVAAHLIANRGLTFAQADHLLQSANAKRETPVLTNKDFVRAMKNYREHLLGGI